MLALLAVLLHFLREGLQRHIDLDVIELIISLIRELTVNCGATLMRCVVPCTLQTLPRIDVGLRAATLLAYPLVGTACVLLLLRLRPIGN